MGICRLANELSLDLAQSIGIYFGLELKNMKLKIGIPRNEQLFYGECF